MIIDLKEYRIAKEKSDLKDQGWKAGKHSGEVLSKASVHLIDPITGPLATSRLSSRGWQKFKKQASKPNRREKAGFYCSALASAIKMKSPVDTIMEIAANYATCTETGKIASAEAGSKHVNIFILIIKQGDGDYLLQPALSIGEGMSDFDTVNEMGVHMYLARQAKDPSVIAVEGIAPLI